MSENPRNTRRSRRMSIVGPGLLEQYVRDNKVIPPVLAVLAVLIFAWIVAGFFVDPPQERQVANEAEIAQTQDPGDDTSPGTGTPAPEVENRDNESYAAYKSKDPFRRLLNPASSADTGADDGTGDDTGTGDGTGGTGGNGDGTGGTGGGNGDGTGTGDGTGGNGGGAGGVRGVAPEVRVPTTRTGTA